MPQHLVEGNLLIKISSLERDTANIAGYQLATSIITESIEIGLTTFFNNKYRIIDPQANTTVTTTVL